MQRAPISMYRPASKSSKRRKSRKRRKSKGSESNREKYAQLNARMSQSTNHPHRGQNLEIWRKTYENLAKWHIQHQTEFWRNRTEHLSKENSELKRQLEASSLKPTTEEYVESSESDDNDEDGGDGSIDEKYLEFLEVTRRHQIEVQKTKQGSTSENC